MAYSLVNNSEYNVNFVLPPLGNGPGPIFNGWNILTALENALGRLPTAEEMAIFGALTSSTEFSSATALAQAFVPAAVAIAQYAADQGDSDNLTVIDPNQDLVAPPNQWENPNLNAFLNQSGTYSYSNYLVVAFGVTAIVAQSPDTSTYLFTIDNFGNLTSSTNISSWVSSAGTVVGSGNLVGLSTRVSNTANSDTVDLYGITQSQINVGTSIRTNFTGTLGNDIITGDLGNNTLTGNGGNDTYQFSRGGGQDQIINGLPSNTGPTGELDFGSNVSD